jgi:RNA polymerase sigma-B factor
MLAALPQRSRLILFLRYQYDMTQSEIAKQTGLSQVHVSRLIRQATDQLRSAYTGASAA